MNLVKSPHTIIKKMKPNIPGDILSSYKSAPIEPNNVGLSNSQI